MKRPVMDVFLLTLALLPAERAAKKCKKNSYSVA